MSEIKGQILGIVLVLAIFGAVAGIMVTLFTNTAGSLEDKVNENISAVVNPQDQSTTTSVAKLGSLTY